MDKAKIASLKSRSLTSRFDELIKSDPVKKVVVDFETLGKEMLNKIPTASLRGDVLVLSDIGLLVAVMVYLKEQNLSNDRVKFIAHTEGVHAAANQFGIVSKLVPYDKLNLFFSGDKGYNYVTADNNIMKFDVIIGNPPYNSPTESTGGAGGRTNLWKKFVERAIDFQLRDGGILCIIHPPTWRAPFSNLKKSKVSSLWKKITVENKLLFLQMLKQPFPGVGTRADFYVLQREPSPPKFITTIVDINGAQQSVCLQDIDFLPNEDFDFVYSMTAPKPDDCLKVIFNSTLYDPRAKHVSKTESIDFKFPILHATNKAGNRFFWANTKRLGHYGIRKLMFGDSGINNVLFDTDGSYACSNHCIGIDVSHLPDEDAIQLKDWLTGEDCNRIVKATLLSSFGLSADIFTKIRKDCWKQNKEINDKDS